MYLYYKNVFSIPKIPLVSVWHVCHCNKICSINCVAVNTKIIV